MARKIALALGGNLDLDGDAVAEGTVFRLALPVPEQRASPRRTNADTSEERRIFQAGDLKMDLDQRSLWKGAEDIRLSPEEFDLLSYLFGNQGAPLTHVKLLRSDPDSAGRQFLEDE